MKEPIKHERAGVRDVPDPKDKQAEVDERRERGAKGEPDPIDFEAGEYHGLTPQQIKRIEDARYDDTDNVKTVDGAGPQSGEQERRLKEQEKEEKDRQTKEKAEREKHEREADHGSLRK